MDYAIFTLDPAGNVSSWNARAERIKGYKPEEVIGRHFSLFYPAGDVAAGKPLQVMQRALTEGLCEEEGQRLRKGGTPFRAIVTVTAQFDRLNHHTGFAVVMHDTTESHRHEQDSAADDGLAREQARREVERKLRSEKRFSDTMIESMPGVVYFYDSRGRFLRWNRNFEIVSGYSGEEIARMHPLDFFADREKPLLENRIAEVFEKGESSVEAEFVARDGTARPYFFTGRSVEFEGVSCLVGVGIDISERRRAEDHLAESEHKYRELVQHANSIILRWSHDGRITFLNEFGQRFFGYTAEEIRGRHVVGTIVPEAESGGRDLKPLMDEICRNPAAFEQNVNQNMRRNGERVWIAWTNKVALDPGGQVEEVLSIGTDITARKRMEEELRATHAGLERRVIERTAELTATTDFLNTILDNTPNLVFYKDAELRYVGCNISFEKAFGVKRADILGRTVLDVEFMSAADRRAFQEEQARLVAEGGTSRRELAVPFADGSLHQTLYTVSAFRHTDGSPGGLVGVIVDITTLKETEAALRASEEQQRRLADELGRVLEYSLDAICVFDEDIRFTRVSAACKELWGYRPEELLGKCYLDMVLPADRDVILAAARQAREGSGLQALEGRSLRKDGSLVHVVWSVVWSPSDRQWYCIARDDSERRKLLSELRHRARELERSTAELVVAKEAAESADRLKSAFLATMSHELRTPLNSIIGFTGIVLQGLAGPLNEEQHKQLGMVQGSARHLLSLINDVLDISKIEAGELSIASGPFDLAASIHKVAGIVAPLAEKKGLALRVDVAEGLGEIVGDARRVEQILLNLLSNAIKFTEAGTVSLAIEPVADYVSRVGAAPCPALRLRVADTGIGIKREDMAVLFTPFRQIDSRMTRKHEGTGLGLAICRRLAGLMGGRIEVESRWGEGSVFTLLLPRQPTRDKEAT